MGLKHKKMEEVTLITSHFVLFCIGQLIFLLCYIHGFGLLGVFS